MSDEIPHLRPDYRPRAALTAALVTVAAGMFAACVSQPLVTPRPPTPTPLSDPAQLERDVRAIVENFRPRGHRDIENLDRVAAFLREELSAAGGRVTEQSYEVDGKIYRNILARFGAPSPSRVVVGAHYDTADGLPGADDNASGVAGLLALARRLGQSPPPGDVELVAFTLEEPPYFGTIHMGSCHHARSLRASGASVKVMISLEMIGYFSDEEDSQSLPVTLLEPLYPSKGNFIAIIGETGGGLLVRKIKAAMLGASDLPVESLNAPPQVQGVDWSDHRSYWREGYPAVMITDTSFFRNRRYHSANDTPDTLDYARMAKVVAGVHQAILALQ